MTDIVQNGQEEILLEVSDEALIVPMITFVATSNEEDLLTHEVLDETLEAAGGNEARNFSMSTCTYYFGCAG